MKVRRALLASLLMLAGCDAPISYDGPVAGWPVYGGDAGGARFSPLTQITRDNVGRLEVAWTFHTGDVLDGSTTRGKSAFQSTPVLLGDTLYVCSPKNRVFALDPETGAQKWVFDPGIQTEGVWNFTCRGVAAWNDPSAREGQQCASRIFTGTVDGRLFALDATTGRPCIAFGDAGGIDLTRGMQPIERGEYGVTSPPTVIGDVVAVGGLVWDGQRTEHAPGVVRGFDARTGDLVWFWDPVPPGTPPLPKTANGEASFHHGTPNAWSIFSVDAARDLLIFGTGNAGPDFFGGERKGLDFYSSSVVALRGATGELVWRFQTVHHDLWDYDVAAQPLLIDVQKDGATIPAVVQGTKMGHVFVLRRDTGEPVWPVEERPVAVGDVPGEIYAPTQPFPTHPKPLHPAKLTAEDAFGFVPWDRNACRDAIAGLRSDGMFTPPSREGSIQYPSVAGGINWGSIAFDPQRRLLVTTQARIASEVTLVARDAPEAKAPQRPFESLFPQNGTPWIARQRILTTPDSPFPVPCSPAPWGTLLAVDLDSGEKRWEVPFGTTRGLAPWPFWFEIGMPSMGGPLVTAGGVVFIGAAMDGYFRAVDVESGEELRKWHLPAGGQATPMTYRMRTDAKQFVVIAAGGHGSFGVPLGDALVGFALR